MCTVSYLPLSEGGFIITSNRDENRARAASVPASLNAEDSTIVFPKDPVSGGSWICASNDGRVVCLLNGAFIIHKHDPPYRKSRGLVVIESFSYASFQVFLDEFDFEDIEPFTLVMRDKLSLTELRWDGSEKHIRALEKNEPHLWASCTLYSNDIVEKRKYWFQQWIQEQGEAESEKYKMENIVHWHSHTGEGDSENDLVMNRNDIVETISITSVSKKDEQLIMSYKDLVNDSITEFSF